MKKTIIFIIVAIVVVGLGVVWWMSTKEDTGYIPTSADNAPPGSIHNLPVPTAVSSVKSLVARELGVDEGVVVVLTAFEKEWSDGCLGLGGANESCLQALVPGYEVKVQAQGKEMVYRTNMDGSVIRREK